MRRVFLIVLDSVGCGELPDAARFGDCGAHTLRSCYNTGLLHLPNLRSLGLGNIEGLGFLGPVSAPLASYGRMAEASCGKDTTTGHWEIAGLVSDTPMPLYPDGFPSDVIDRLEAAIGRGTLVNRPYSGTDVIRDYGREQIATGRPIVYTSADSVMQIAAHTGVVPLETLYAWCTAARTILTGEHAVGRVIARPFTGEWPYIRTPDRRDFSLKPPGATMLDVIKDAGLDVIAVGKITDIFAGCGITRSILSHGNPDCMSATDELAKEDFWGLCFVNLVDFDMVYGHRNDAVGYAGALNAFDVWLGRFLPGLRDDDLLLITADHGCDPADVSTDHTREYVPILMYSPSLASTVLGSRTSYADAAATVCAALNVSAPAFGTPFCAF